MGPFQNNNYYKYYVKLHITKDSIKSPLHSTDAINSKKSQKQYHMQLFGRILGPENA